MQRSPLWGQDLVASAVLFGASCQGFASGIAYVVGSWNSNGSGRIWPRVYFELVAKDDAQLWSILWLKWVWLVFLWRLGDPCRVVCNGKLFTSNPLQKNASHSFGSYSVKHFASVSFSMSDILLRAFSSRFHASERHRGPQWAWT